MSNLLPDLGSRPMGLDLMPSTTTLCFMVLLKLTETMPLLVKLVLMRENSDNWRSSKSRLSINSDGWPSSVGERTSCWLTSASCSVRVLT